MIELDNLLSEFRANDIEAFMSSINFPWYYNPSIAGNTHQSVYDNDANVKDADGFVHIFSTDGNISSPHNEIVNVILNALESRLDIKITNVWRARAALIPKNPELAKYYQTPHCDYSVPHYTLIYYVNDNDGDTVFFKEYYEKDNYEKKNVSQRVTPNKGSCVIFDGLQYHTGTVPATTSRMLININFTANKPLNLG